MSTEESRYAKILSEVTPKRLIQIRKDAGDLTQGDFAERLSLSLRGYSNYETGKRILPMTARMAIVDEFGTDPLPTETLRTALGCASELPPAPEKPEISDRGFWPSLREERRGFLKASYSAPARFLLAVQDHAFISATTYCSFKQLALHFSIPFGFESNGVDWVHTCSFLVILFLIIPVLKDAPISKMLRHVAESAKSITPRTP